MNKAWKLIISITLPLVVGALAGFFTASSVNDWFPTLDKPSFNPPSWLFAPVWTALYLMMGIAVYLVWTSNAVSAVKQRALVIYLVQLAFNFSWSFIFFYAKEIGWALVDIVLLWTLILVTILHFSRISKTAAWLLVPYIAWVSFATALNFALWQLN